MKKYFLVLLSTALICSQLLAQSKGTPITVDGKAYEQMKLNGKLQGITVNNATSFTPTLQDLKNLGITHKMPANGSGCSCYQAPDGTYTLAMTPNDDGSSNLISIPFNFCLYGTQYNSLYINNNGNISFVNPYYTFSASAFPDPTYIMVAPFWGDVDTRGPGGAGGAGTVQYKITPTALYVNWEGVGYFNEENDMLNTFQLIITNGNDPVLPAGNNIAFCYKDMQWTTGAASQGVGGFGGVPATVGVNQGAPGNNYIQMGRFDQPGSAYDGGYGNNDGVSWLDNQSFYFNSCNSTNIAPIVSGLNNCDTVKICGAGDTLVLNGLFLSPELGQTTTVTVNLNGTPNATVLNTTAGNSATAEVRIIASAANAGNNVITFIATDNGTPVQSTTVNVVGLLAQVNRGPTISGLAGGTTFSFTMVDL